LTALLKEDVTLSMPPVPSWYHGRSDVLEFLVRNPLSAEWRGRLRLQPTWANRRPAFAVYHQAEDEGMFQPFGLMTLGIQGEAIAEVLGFVDPALFRFFDVPPHL
jgi:RNA polymerase sigma-70 factor (ECF subfamily)